MSHGSKIGISLLIGLRRPLVKGRERIVEQPPITLCQNDPVTLDIVDKLVSRLQAKRGSHRGRDRRLRLAGELARNHPLARSYDRQKVRKFLTDAKLVAYRRESSGGQVYR
jgi:hypothetical protein